jgi:AcrR family transcriptional regulator
LVYRATARTRARLADNRRRLVEEASTLVTEEGFAAVSIARVAEAAEIAAGTVYRYFPSKADLLAEVFRRAAGREVEVMRAAAIGTAPVRERLRRALELFSDRALRSGRLAWALLVEPIDPAVEAERIVFRRAYADVLVQLLREGTGSGELPAQDESIAAAAIVGALGEALLTPLAVDGRAAEGHRAIRAAVDFCMRGVG